MSATTTNLHALNCGDTFQSEGMTLTIWQRNNLDEVTGLCATLHATQDGRVAIMEWHTGPEAEWVYFERIDEDGFGSHGWVDSVSRKLLQTG